MQSAWYMCCMWQTRSWCHVCSSMHAMLCSYKCGIHKCGHSSWHIISGHVHGSWLCVEWYRNYGHKSTERGSPSFPIDGGFHYLLLLHWWGFLSFLSHPLRSSDQFVFLLRWSLCFGFIPGWDQTAGQEQWRTAQWVRERKSVCMCVYTYGRCTWVVLVHMCMHYGFVYTSICEEMCDVWYGLSLGRGVE